MKVLYSIPVTIRMSPCKITGTSSEMETAYENALWEYNSMLARDGHNPVKSLPHGTTVKLLEEDENA